MILSEDETYYEILDVPTNASPEDVRRAYLRIKAAYEKESVVLYSLIASEEREETLKRIENAYLVLSDSEKRRQYDKSHGFIQFQEEKEEEAAAPEEELLVTPRTDAGIFSFAGFGPTFNQNTEFGVRSVPISTDTEIKPQKGTEVLPEVQKTKTEDPIPSELTLEIEKEIEWRGCFLKKIREAHHISLEELSISTKVSRNYLSAIEEENYSKLPAAVYIRGFVQQIAKTFKLPADKVASAYVSRCVEAKVGHSR